MKSRHIILVHIPVATCDKSWDFTMPAYQMEVRGQHFPGLSQGHLPVIGAYNCCSLGSPRACNAHLIMSITRELVASLHVIALRTLFRATPINRRAAFYRYHCSRDEFSEVLLTWASITHYHLGQPTGSRPAPYGTEKRSGPQAVPRLPLPF